MQTYENFDLYVDADGADYRVSALKTPAGDGSAPLSAQAVKELQQQALSAQLQPKAFGAKLYQTIFQGAVGQRFETSLALTQMQGQGLRIRLNLNQAVALQALAWEYLYDPTRNYFFATTQRTPIVRYLAVSDPVRPLKTTLPLSILVILASPKDLLAERQIDLEKEWLALQAAFAPLVQTDKVVLERLPAATLAALQQRMQGGDVAILHLLGHGHFDGKREEAALLLENSEGNSKRVLVEELMVRLRDHPPRLVYLNSCETAQSGLQNPFAGAAQALVQAGIPAVVAMQQKIFNTAAHTIAAEFYQALAAGYPVDAALAEGRIAAYGAAGPVEWGTPVLFMRSPDGVLFTLADAVAQPVIDQKELINILLESATLQDPLLRNDVVNALPANIRNSVQRRPVLKADVRSIVSACLNYHGGLTALVKVLEDEFEGESQVVIKLKALIAV